MKNETPNITQADLYIPMNALEADNGDYYEALTGIAAIQHKLEAAIDSERSPSEAEIKNQLEQLATHYMYEYLDAEDGTIQEELMARNASGVYLLLNGVRIATESANDVDEGIKSRNAYLSTATNELYTPDIAESAISKQESDKITQELLSEPALNTAFEVVDRYFPEELALFKDIMNPLLTTADVEQENQKEVYGIKTEELQAALRKVDPSAMELYDKAASKTYTEAEARDITREYLDLLTKEDPIWADWKITNKPGSSVMNVAASKKEISMPDDRKTGFGSKEELFGFILHEVRVHGGRAVASEKRGDDLGRLGMPGYDAAEEGVGTFFEFIMTGKASREFSGRYLDMALADGTLGPKLGREDMVKFKRARLAINKVLDQMDRNPDLAASTISIDPAVITSRANSFTERLFRGSSRTEFNESPGVNYKDSVYHAGLPKIKEYVESASKEHALEDVLSYLLEAKFDPTNPSHVQYLENQDVTL